MKQKLTMNTDEIVQACKEWMAKHHPDRVTDEPVYLNVEAAETAAGSRSLRVENANGNEFWVYVAITVTQESEL